ncbi:MAG: 3-hydroxybutyryl-CoA dehydrogenase, partial [Marmoricola sp.]|nr:3-hydroxybutyryl-CoA dehydrogenase [Marmoricola sp.]
MINKVGVVGGGLMGSGIIEVAGRAGLDVIGVEINADAAKAAADRVEGSLRRAESRGKIQAADVTAILQRIRFEADLETLADRDLVVEAAS